MTPLLHRWLPKIWLIHAAYDLVTGIWSLVGIESFQKITGPKTDTWLVKTVGVLVCVIGAVIGVAGGRHRVTPEIAGLAIGSTAALAAVDVVYVSRRRISPVYLLDAVMSVILISAWALAVRGKHLPIAKPGPGSPLD